MHNGAKIAIFIIFAPKIVEMIQEKNQVVYPQNFDIKMVFVSSIPMEETKKNIHAVFQKCQVVHTFVDVRSSAKGNYYSYCYNIDIESKEHLELTYKSLRSLPGLKFAL
jgi:putative lipoic acid-binding regulatory protein